MSDNFTLNYELAEPELLALAYLRAHSTDDGPAMSAADDAGCRLDRQHHDYSYFLAIVYWAVEFGYRLYGDRLPEVLAAEQRKLTEGLTA